MKPYKLLSSLVAIMFCFGVSSAFAADVTHFVVEANPATTQASEAVDITVKAVDKDNNVISDYLGEVLIFSESDVNAEFPGVLEQGTYTFQDSDAGEVKFENAVKFSQEGVQDISVYDYADESILGKVEIEVSNANKVEEKLDIAITSPDSGTIIGENSLKISGTTTKNHMVKVVVNNSNEFPSQSNDEGVFEAVISDLASGETTFVAKVLNADGKEVGVSAEIKVSIESNLPKLMNVKIVPAGEVEPETVINIELLADAGLTEVTVIMNEISSKLEETEAGKYTGTLAAPKEEGDFPIQVKLKDELGHESNESPEAKITVKLAPAPEPVVEPELAPAPVLEAAPEENIQDKLIIAGLNLAKLDNKSVLSWDGIDIAESYNVYRKDPNTKAMKLIKNVTEPRITINIKGDKITHDDFAVKAVAKDKGQTIESKNYSDLTKIQTGPEHFFMLMLLLSLFISSFLLYFRGRRT